MVSKTNIRSRSSARLKLGLAIFFLGLTLFPSASSAMGAIAINQTINTESIIPFSENNEFSILSTQKAEVTFDKPDLDNKILLSPDDDQEEAFSGEDQCLYTEGNWFLSLITNPLDTIVKAFLFLFISIFKWVLKIIVSIFVWLLSPQNFGGYVNHPIVRTLWTVMIPFANIMIILALIFTAVCTILGIKKYNLYSNLWRVLLVALLVNFTLVICGMFVDISNFLTVYFLTGMTSDGKIQIGALYDSVITKIACSFQNVPSKTTKALYSLVAGISAIAICIIFISQMVGIISHTVIRVVTLWFTLLLSPVAFASLALPGLEKGWETWLQYFTQALISLPVIAFCMYLTIFMLVIATKSIADLQASGAGSTTFAQVLGWAILMIGISQVTLTVAGALNIGAVKQGYNKTKSFVTGALTGAAVVGGKNIMKGVKASETYHKVGGTLAKSPIKAIRNVGTNMLGEKEKLVGEEQSKFEKLDTATLKSLEKSRLNQTDRIALTNTLASRGKLGKESIAFIDTHKDITGLNTKAIANAVPHEFTLQNGKLVNTTPGEEVKNLSEVKDFSLVQIKDFLNHYRDAQGNLDPKAVEEITKLRPAQLAKFMGALDEDTLAEFLKLINQSDTALENFNKALTVSPALQEITGLHPIKFNQLDTAALKSLEKSRLSPTDKITLTNTLAERGALGKESIDFIENNLNIAGLNTQAIANALPHEFTIKGGQLVKTKKGEEFQALSEVKDFSQVQMKDFLNHFRDAQGNLKNIVADELTKLSPAQLAELLKGFDKDTLAEFLKLVQQNATALDNFNKALAVSPRLQEITGLQPQSTSSSTSSTP
jgi:hypothetical protein